MENLRKECDLYGGHDCKYCKKEYCYNCIRGCRFCGKEYCRNCIKEHEKHCAWNSQADKRLPSDFVKLYWG